MRDEAFVDSYVDKYQLNRNDISPLFKDKTTEMLADDSDPKHLLTSLEAKNLKNIQESNA